MVQEEAGLQRRFAPRNDEVGTRSFAMTGGVIASGSDAIQLVVQEKAGLQRRFAPRNDAPPVIANEREAIQLTLAISL